MQEQTDVRNEIIIMTLDEMVSEDNHVRAIDVIVDHLIDEMKIEFPIGKSRVGRPAYPPAYLTKLHIYGYINGLTSSRMLEWKAQDSIELSWLLSGLTPGNRTIALFRKNYRELIDQVFHEMLNLLASEQLVSNFLMAIDGHKKEARAASDIPSAAKLRKSIINLQTKVIEYLQQISEPDKRKA